MIIIIIIIIIIIRERKRERERERTTRSRASGRNWIVVVCCDASARYVFPTAEDLGVVDIKVLPAP